MKLKRFFINIILIGGISLSSCTFSNIDSIKEYINEHSFSCSSWNGIDSTYMMELTSKGDTNYTFSYLSNYKATNVNNSLNLIYQLEVKEKYVLDGKTEKHTYKAEAYIGEGVIYSYIEDDGESTSNIEYQEDLLFFNYYFLLFLEAASLLSNYHNALSLFEEENISFKGSFRQNNKGTNIKFTASWDESYGALVSTYSDKCTLKYDSNDSLTSFHLETSQKDEYNFTSNKDTIDFSQDISLYDATIKKPSWVK